MQLGGDDGGRAAHVLIVLTFPIAISEEATVIGPIQYLLNHEEDQLPNEFSWASCVEPTVPFALTLTLTSPNPEP